MIKIESNRPHGFGRLIKKDKKWFTDGQFKDGMYHGYLKDIKSDNTIIQYEYKNNIIIKDW